MLIYNNSKKTVLFHWMESKSVGVQMNIQNINAADKIRVDSVNRDTCVEMNCSMAFMYRHWTYPLHHHIWAVLCWIADDGLAREKKIKRKCYSRKFRIHTLYKHT